MPLAVAKLCKEYQTESGNQSLLWIGSGTGRGPVQLHNVFHNVSVFYTCSSNSNVLNRISGVMVSMLTSSVVDRGFEPQSGQTKMCICCNIKEEETGWLRIRIMCQVKPHFYTRTVV